MSVLSRSALEASPLADLHAIASELGIDGFRRLRKADLVDAILDPPGRRGRRSRPRRRRGRRAEPEARPTPPRAAGARPRRGRRGATARPTRRRGRRRRRGGRGRRAARGRGRRRASAAARRAPRRREARRGRARAAAAATAVRTATREPAGDREAEQVAEGVVELLANGSGFLRLTPARALRRRRLHLGRPGPPLRARRAATASPGPVRRPRRSERYPSLVRVDTINGTAGRRGRRGRRRSTTCPARWPTERIALGAEDPTLKAIEWLTPIGRGSRVDDRRRGPRGQERGAAPPGRRAAGQRRARGVRRPRRRPARGGAPSGAPTARSSRSPPLTLRRERRRAGPGRRARGRHRQAHRGPRRPRRRPARRRARRGSAPARRAPGAGRGARARRRRLADDRRGRDPAGRRRDDGRRARRGAHGAGRFPALDLVRERHAAPRAARGRRRRGGDRPGAAPRRSARR